MISTKPFRDAMTPQRPVVEPIGVELPRALEFVSEATEEAHAQRDVTCPYLMSIRALDEAASG
jgi:hypothetical protein